MRRSSPTDAISDHTTCSPSQSSEAVPLNVIRERHDRYSHDRYSLLEEFSNSGERYRFYLQLYKQDVFTSST
jgi:hypothetical protein